MPSEWDYKAYRQSGGKVKKLSRKEMISRIRDFNKHPFHIIYERGRYHGPGWSAGKHQDSIDYRLDPNAPPPASERDYYAMVHDARYARVMQKYKLKGYTDWRHPKFGDKDLVNADFQFAKRQWKSGSKISAIGVGAQGAARWIAAKFTKQVKPFQYVTYGS